MACGEHCGHLLQVLEAAEERQIVTGRFGKLRCNQLADRRDRGGSMLITGRDMADYLHAQLLGCKG
ncbi:hypothetical protein D3C76_1627180 [compost metagenome]